MIKITSACGGDVIKFAGDALIVLWTEGPKSVQAHRACECAMELQDALHDCPMTETIRLSLKVGVGQGAVSMFYVGGHNGRCEYFAAGPALCECFATSDAAASGDVIVSRTVWGEVKDQCDAINLPNGFHSLKTMRKSFRKRSVHRSHLGSSVVDVQEALRAYVPSVLLSAHALERSLGQSVRGWTVSVLQATVVFVNLGLGGLMDHIKLDYEKIHAAVVTIQRIVTNLQGYIHRFTFDDKGFIMKVVFGAHLPHEDQPYRAVLAALELRQALGLQGIQPAVGVATGESLIGPVGSAFRQEFTVHGDKTILAARLMQLATKKGGMILCDNQTFTTTGDDVRYVELEPVKLKGKSTTVRPYSPVASCELFEKPKLTAKTEGEYCLSLEPLKRALANCDEWLAKSNALYHAIVVTGGHGSGKTQLLNQMRQRSEASCNVLHVCCRAHETPRHGTLLRRLLAQLRGCDIGRSRMHIKSMATSSAADTEEAQIEHEVSLLLSRTSASSLEAQEQPSSDLHSVANGPFVPAVDLTYSMLVAFEKDFEKTGRLVIIIDDVNYADAHSCKVLRHLAQRSPESILLVLACREPCVSLSGLDEDQSEQLSSGHRLVHDVLAMVDGTTTSLQLRPANASSCEQLACAELGVKSLPEGVGALIAKRGGSIPLLCQAIARNLVQRGALVVEDGSCRLGPFSTERALNVATTEAIVKTRHTMICVKLAEISLLQQIILKTMSMLPEPCPLNLLSQAMPIQLGQPALSTQLRLLRDRHLIAVPQSHRRSLPGTWQQSQGNMAYNFVDVGMREVCLHLMVDAQKRPIRLRLAAANESRQGAGNLADSFTSSLTGDELARSLSPSMLRRSLRNNQPKNVSSAPVSYDDTHEEKPLRASSTEQDKQWWLSKSHDPRIQASRTSRRSPTRLVQPLSISESPSSPMKRRSKSASPSAYRSKSAFAASPGQARRLMRRWARSPKSKHVPVSSLSPEFTRGKSSPGRINHISEKSKSTRQTSNLSSSGEEQQQTTLDALRQISSVRHRNGSLKHVVSRLMRSLVTAMAMTSWTGGSVRPGDKESKRWEDEDDKSIRSTSFAASSHDPELTVNCSPPQRYPSPGPRLASSQTMRLPPDMATSHCTSASRSSPLDTRLGSSDMGSSGASVLALALADGDAQERLRPSAARKLFA